MTLAQHHPVSLSVLAIYLVVGAVLQVIQWV